MISKNIENIIVKFLAHQCSIVELDQLEEWLEEEENEKIFREYVKLNFLIDINTTEFNDLATQTILKNTFHKPNPTMNRFKGILKYAAAAIILISSSIYFFQNNSNEPESNFGNEVILKTESGKIKILKNNSTNTIKAEDGTVVGKQNGKIVSYEKNLQLEKLVYNTISVPYGKKFNLKLSDGTRISLNSGTIIKYPVSFISGKPREVFIEEGEAYFDVAPDKNHPFTVTNNKVNVTVLGTEFNFSSYPEDKNITTVLVEGSVKISESNSNQELMLTPGFKASLNKINNDLDVSKADLDFHTAWLNGKIIMKHMEFRNIVRKLERHYDVIINNEDKVLDTEMISAVFEGESIEEVLELINKIHPIKYEIDGKSITIQKTKK